MRIPRLLDKGLNEDIAILVLVPLFAFLQRLGNRFIDKLVTRLASFAKRLVVDEPVQIPQASATRQVILARVESRSEPRLLTSNFSPVHGLDGIAKQEEHGRVEGKLEEQRLEVDDAVFRYAIHDILDAALDLLKVLVAVRRELRTQQLARVFPGRSVLGEDA